MTAQLPREKGGGLGKVAYIDTEGTLYVHTNPPAINCTSRPERIGPIAERYGLNHDEVLENIIVGRAFTHEHQNDLITAIAAKMVEERFALLVHMRQFRLTVRL